MHSLIEKLNLKPHPEGGYYGEVYRSQQNVASPAHQQQRSAVTHIYFLLLKGQRSRFHQVQHDEIWNFYAGAPLKLLHIESDLALSSPANTTTQAVTIGKSDSYVHVIPAKHWQAAESSGEYSLVGCSVAPGFDFADFRFMSTTQVGWIEQHRPEWQDFI
ncbi:cupin domain-containing protein [Alteromonas sp. ASW11-36]|uniref:Cupin domain-containing protein n=1 Tax=Alteromonas arenosi TaxID=3055817 RepID=A0ABT7SU56_9ALTE|nr:cupin domain-containing protein [Alteromonas sp. ASW11-36]MDM7859082.1 cupin domain-containing protein [Alteromonas sp. ASW11-36]